MWENLQLDEPYATVARNLDALVKSKSVVDVFITRDYELGIDRNNPEVTITKKAVDPIVYQPCAYGVLIHSIWGEESEDKVFEEYKRINNLML